MANKIKYQIKAMDKVSPQTLHDIILNRINRLKIILDGDMMSVASNAELRKFTSRTLEVNLYLMKGIFGKTL